MPPIFFTIWANFVYCVSSSWTSRIDTPAPRATLDARPVWRVNSFAPSWESSSAADTWHAAATSHKFTVIKNVQWTYRRAVVELSPRFAKRNFKKYQKIPNCADLCASEIPDTCRFTPLKRAWKFTGLKKCIDDHTNWCHAPRFRYFMTSQTYETTPNYD